MALFEEEEMTWREFEKLCEKLVTDTFHGDTWKVKYSQCGLMPMARRKEWTSKFPRGGRRKTLRS